MAATAGEAIAEAVQRGHGRTPTTKQYTKQPNRQGRMSEEDGWKERLVHALRHALKCAFSDML